MKFTLHFLVPPSIPQQWQVYLSIKMRNLTHTHGICRKNQYNSTVLCSHRERSTCLLDRSYHQQKSTRQETSQELNTTTATTNDHHYYCTTTTAATTHFQQGIERCDNVVISDVYACVPKVRFYKPFSYNKRDFQIFFIC